MKKIGVLLAIMVSVTLTGCVGKMALVKGQSDVKTSDKSIILLPVKISNQNRTGYQPNLILAEVTGAKNQKIDIKDGLFKESKNEYKDYLLSFSLEPGAYTISNLIGHYRIPLLVNAFCSVPLNAPIEVKPNTIIYLGRINATIVERKEDDNERAGSLLPLIDQAIAGFSNGTFIINIEDQYDVDVADYRKEYPGLKGVTIEKSILPQWQRANTSVAVK